MKRKLRKVYKGHKRPVTLHSNGKLFDSAKEDVCTMNLTRRLLISMGTALLFMYIGDRAPQIVGIPQIFLVVYFPFFFFFGSLHNPFYSSVIIRGVAYILVFLFWTAVFCMITWVLKR